MSHAPAVTEANAIAVVEANVARGIDVAETRVDGPSFESKSFGGAQ